LVPMYDDIIIISIERGFFNTYNGSPFRLGLKNIYPYHFIVSLM